MVQSQDGQKRREIYNHPPASIAYSRNIPRWRHPQWETGKFPKDLKKSFSPKSLVIENLTDFKYTNYGYSLLGLVIEKASGMRYADYVGANILKPLE